MELSELRYFVHVADARSFVRGAERAHVSPPAISKAIRKLEDELGTPLFVRTTRRVALTPSGEALRRHCLTIFDDLERARRELMDGATQVSGPLRVGAMEAFSILLLPLALSRLLRSHPLVEPESHELVPQEIERLIIQGRIDIGLTIGAGNVAGVRYETLGRSPGVLVCGRGHPLYRGGRIGVTDLERHRFVVPRFLGMEHLPVLDQFPERRFPRRVGATIELLQMGVQLVAEGSYLGFFPEICVREQLARRRMRVLEGLRLGVRFELQALTRAEAAPRRAVQLLIAELGRLLGPKSQQRPATLR